MLIYVAATGKANPNRFAEVCASLVGAGHTIAQPTQDQIDLMSLVRCDHAIIVCAGANEPEVLGLCQACHDCHVPYDIHNGSTAIDPYIQIHPVLQHNPQQCLGFMAVIMQQYRVHLDKNMDYGTGNILVTGEVGVLTRIMDKVLRYANLMGLRLAFSGPGTWHAVAQPENESIDDTLLDLANYGVIGTLVRKGLWGK